MIIVANNKQRVIMQPENQQTTFQPPRKSRAKKVLKVTLPILLILLVGGLAGWKWYGQIQEYKTDKNNSEKHLSELEAKIRDLKSVESETTGGSTNNGEDVIQNDLVQIKKALTAACVKESGSGYVSSVVSSLDKAYLLSNFENSSQKHYNGGFAAISHGCVEAGQADSEAIGGGYVSILKKQPNGTWLEITGTQSSVACSIVNQYKIPATIIPTCNSVAGGDEVNNTN